MLYYTPPKKAGANAKGLWNITGARGTASLSAVRRAMVPVPAAVVLLCGTPPNRNLPFKQAGRRTVNLLLK